MRAQAAAAASLQYPLVIVLYIRVDTRQPRLRTAIAPGDDANDATFMHQWAARVALAGIGAALQTSSAEHARKHSAAVDAAAGLTPYGTHIGQEQHVRERRLGGEL